MITIKKDKTLYRIKVKRKKMNDTVHTNSMNKIQLKLSIFPHLRPSTILIAKYIDMEIFNPNTMARVSC